MSKHVHAHNKTLKLQACLINKTQRWACSEPSAGSGFSCITLRHAPLQKRQTPRQHRGKQSRPPLAEDSPLTHMKALAARPGPCGGAGRAGEGGPALSAETEAGTARRQTDDGFAPKCSYSTKTSFSADVYHFYHCSEETDQTKQEKLFC